MRVGVSYLRSALSPIEPESNLEQFFINRFGYELYQTFFKSYTEKVWGVPCDQISASWGAQRIKGLSIVKTLTHAAKKALGGVRIDIRQKDTETSLIERFLYPKYGPGQMWEIVADEVKQKGGEVLMRQKVTKLLADGARIVGAEVTNSSGEVRQLHADYFISTMPVRQLLHALDCEVPPSILQIADGLIYRDFLSVGLLLKDLKLRTADGRLVKDNWIYIQEPDVDVGRLQIFNNWSPYMVADPKTVWVGLEYFCFENDALWGKSDEELIAHGRKELVKMNMMDDDAFLDGTVVRMPKAYPAYFGSYDRFSEIREYLDKFENLFLVGRNGMHRYNNQDHSMLAAMAAVDAIAAGTADKEAIWSVNVEEEYHEERSA